MILMLLLSILLYVELSTGFSLGRNIQLSLILRPQTSYTFMRICVDPRSADCYYYVELRTWFFPEAKGFSLGTGFSPGDRVFPSLLILSYCY